MKLVDLTSLKWEYHFKNENTYQYKNSAFRVCISVSFIIILPVQSLQFHLLLKSFMWTIPLTIGKIGLLLCVAPLVLQASACQELVLLAVSVSNVLALNSVSQCVFSLPSHPSKLVPACLPFYTVYIPRPEFLAAFISREVVNLS